MDKIDEAHLSKEKNKLLKQDGFQILEYIRSSIEIIMNLKIEDLEKEMHHKRHAEAGDNGNTSGRSLSDSIPTNLRDALSG